ncbi:MAG: hypothetical protein ACKVIQ_04380 [Acidimicrobiales bacterium]
MKVRLLYVTVEGAAGHSDAASATAAEADGAQLNCDVGSSAAASSASSAWCWHQAHSCVSK